jgi:hypothetical protein
MKINELLLIALLGGSLPSCAAQLEQQAITKLKADCAAKGLQFVQTGSQKTDNPIISEAQVSGECVGPTDPRYVSPASQ